MSFVDLSVIIIAVWLVMLAFGYAYRHTMRKRGHSYCDPWWF